MLFSLESVIHGLIFFFFAGKCFLHIPNNTDKSLLLILSSMNDDASPPYPPPHTTPTSFFFQRKKIVQFNKDEEIYGGFDLFNNKRKVQKKKGGKLGPKKIGFLLPLVFVWLWPLPCLFYTKRFSKNIKGLWKNGAN